MAAAITGRCVAMTGEVSSWRCRVSAPMRMVSPAASMPARPAMPLMSTSSEGRSSRKFSIGTRLWPPAMSLASPSDRRSAAIAASTLSALT
jgi:hypothetical protein